MPLPPHTDPYGTWWTLRDLESILHGVMFMKKLNVGDHQEPKTSQIADEHLVTNLLNQGSFNILDRLFSGEAQPNKKRKLEETRAPVKNIVSDKGKGKEGENGEAMEVEHDVLEPQK